MGGRRASLPMCVYEFKVRLRALDVSVCVWACVIGEGGIGVVIFSG